MYLSFEDLVLCILKALILTFIIFGLGLLGGFDYHLGVVYCNLMNIPKDLALSMVSPGMAINIGILLFVVEMFGLHFIVNLFIKFYMFNIFFQFLSLDY